MTAVAGTTSARRPPPESTSTFTNMPGRSRPSGFWTVARTRTLRVAASTSGLMVVTSPSQRGVREDVGAQARPLADLSSASACCGSQNSA